MFALDLSYLFAKMEGFLFPAFLKASKLISTSGAIAALRSVFAKEIDIFYALDCCVYYFWNCIILLFCCYYWFKRVLLVLLAIWLTLTPAKESKIDFWTELSSFSKKNCCPPCVF